MKKTTLGVALVAIATLAMVGGGGIANAEDNDIHVNAYQQLRLQTSAYPPDCVNGSTNGWQRVTSRDPLDNNKGAVSTVVTGGCTAAITAHA